MTQERYHLTLCKSCGRIEMQILVRLPPGITSHPQTAGLGKWLANHDPLRHDVNVCLPNTKEGRKCFI